MSTTRSDQARNLEKWAATVKPGDLIVADTDALQTIAALVDQRDAIDSALVAAVGAAREAGRSWSEIGVMLGVSKQAAQQRYSSKLPAPVGDGRRPPEGRRT
ncbi:MAG: hypothetical protein RIE08_15380 [Acidimicrobiales bacterium]